MGINFSRFINLLKFLVVTAGCALFLWAQYVWSLGVTVNFLQSWVVPSGNESNTVPKILGWLVQIGPQVAILIALTIPGRWSRMIGWAIALLLNGLDFATNVGAYYDYKTTLVIPESATWQPVAADVFGIGISLFITWAEEIVIPGIAVAFHLLAESFPGMPLRNFFRSSANSTWQFGSPRGQPAPWATPTGGRTSALASAGPLSQPQSPHPRSQRPSIGSNNSRRPTRSRSRQSNQGQVEDIEQSLADLLTGRR